MLTIIFFFSYFFRVAKWDIYLFLKKIWNCPVSFQSSEYFKGKNVSRSILLPMKVEIIK